MVAPNEKPATAGPGGLRWSRRVTTWLIRGCTRAANKKPGALRLPAARFGTLHFRIYLGFPCVKPCALRSPHDPPTRSHIYRLELSDRAVEGMPARPRTISGRAATTPCPSPAAVAPPPHRVSRRLHPKVISALENIYTLIHIKR